MRGICVFVLTISLICGACVKKDRYDFYNEASSALDVYVGNSRELAKESMFRFISNAETHINKIDNPEKIKYSLALGMSWLRLASIYRNEGDEHEYKYAMRRSVRYFDDVGNIAEDPRYKADKEQALLNLLSQSETVGGPKWKANSTHQQVNPTRQP